MCVLGSEISYTFYTPKNMRTTCIQGNVRLNRKISDRSQEVGGGPFSVRDPTNGFLVPSAHDKLALHGSTKSTLLDVVSIYHGVFVDQYASKYNIISIEVLKLMSLMSIECA